jgi:hypothetical protein
VTGFQRRPARRRQAQHRAGHHGRRGRDFTQALTRAKPGPPRLTRHTPRHALLTAALDVGVPPGDA